MRVLEVGGLAAGYCGRHFVHAGARVARCARPAPDSWVSAEALDRFLHTGKATVDETGLAAAAREADLLVVEGTPDEIDEAGWLALPGPRVRVAVTPFGMTGPRRAWHATGSVLLALGGYTYLMGDPERAPLTLPGHYVAYQAGQHAFVVAGALAFADSAGVADVSMWETVLSLSQFTTVMYSCNGEIRRRHGSSFGLLYPINVFPCADGWFHVNVVPSFWPVFTDMLQRPDLEHDPRFADNAARLLNQAELDGIIHAALGGLTKAEVLERGSASRVPTGILQSFDEVLADPHLAHRDAWHTTGGVRVPRVPWRMLAQ